MKLVATQSVFSLVGLLAAGLITGCATSPSTKVDKLSAQENAKRARPYLEGASMALPSENSAICRVPTDVASPVRSGAKASPASAAEVHSWKTWVLAGGACVRDQKWSEVLRIGEWLSQNEMEAPWGPYFLSLHAQARGESLRAHWLLDLAEKKAGGEMAVVQYERARQSLARGETRAAVSFMKAAVAKDADLAPAQLWLAQVHEREQLWEDAVTHYAAYLKLRPKAAAAHFAFAEIQLQRQKPDEAVEPLLRAIHLEPTSLKTRLKLATVYEQLLKDPESSLKVLREARSVASDLAPGSRSAAGKSKRDRGSQGTPDHRIENHEIQQIDQRIRVLEEQVKARQPAQAQSPRPSARQAVPSGRSPSESVQGGG